MSEQAMTPDRIWVSAPNEDNEVETWTDPDEGGTPYIRATPTSLAESPEVAKLVAEAVAAERDRCVAIAVRHWEGEPEDTIAMAAEIRKGDTP